MLYNQAFIEAITSEGLFDVAILKNIVENSFNERNELDFKIDFPNAIKIAKTILAMANNGGGTIIFGIADDGKAVGISKEKLQDTTDFEREVRGFLPNNLNFIHQVISLNEDDVYGELSGKTFFIISTPKQNRYIPFIAKKQGKEIDTNVIYIRSNSSNETATNEDLEKMIELRLLTQYDDLSNMSLQEHIDQLKLLYNSISPRYSTLFNPMQAAINNAFSYVANVNYPEESFDKFVARAIEKKKVRIEQVLEVDNIE